jgi:methyl-accepting chemotaxis protein
MLSRVGIGPKIYGIIMLMAVMMIGTVAYLMDGTSKLGSELQTIMQETDRAVMHATRVSTGTLTCLSTTNEMVLTTAAAPQMAELEAKQDSCLTRLKELGAALRRGTAAGDKALEAVGRELDTFFASATRVRTLKRSGKPEDDQAATAEWRARGRPAADQIGRGMANLIGTETELSSQRSAAVVADGGRAMTIAWIGIAATLLLCGGLSLWVSRAGITQPVAQIEAAMRNLADGDLSVAVPGLDRRDELGRMAKTVALFKTQAQAAERAAREHAEQNSRVEAEKKASLGQMAESFEAEVGELVAKVASAATELEATARGMSTSADRVNAEASSVASAAGEASGGVQTVAAAAEELSASISEISRQVSASAGMSVKAVEDARRTDKIVQELADAAQRIGEVVALISGIAGQTNLLALNATIEAARAGDAGKGFAVVASEVKTLAQQTAKATEEISSQIGHIQNTTSDAVTAIRSIGSAIEEVSSIATAIAGAVEEQGAATSEISRNVHQTAASTKHVSSSIGTVSAAANDTGAAACQVLGAAGDLSKQAEHLRAQVRSFVSSIRAA